MKITDLIREELIVPELHSADKQDVIEELAEVLSRRHPSVPREELVRVLVERERKGSTAVGEELAIPHGKLPAAEGIIACLGRARKGIDFGAADGSPTRFVFALIVPEKAAGAHLKALARISRLFMDKDFRARLLEAETARDMHEIIASEDAKR